MSGASTMVPCQGSSGDSRNDGLPSSWVPSSERRCDHILVGVFDPPMFWSDFHSIHGVPSSSTKTRGSMEPPWSSWQMNGAAAAVKGPVGESEKALADALGLG